MPKLLLALVALLCVVELPTAKGQGKLSVCPDCAVNCRCSSVIQTLSIVSIPDVRVDIQRLLRIAEDLDESMGDLEDDMDDIEDEKMKSRTWMTRLRTLERG